MSQALAGAMLGGSVMVSMQKFIVAAAQASCAGGAEFRGRLAATILMAFQFLRATESSYVAHLNLVTCLESRRAGRTETLARNRAGTWNCSYRLMGLSSDLPSSRDFLRFGPGLGFHG